MARKWAAGGRSEHFWGSGTTTDPSHHIHHRKHGISVGCPEGFFEFLFRRVVSPPRLIMGTSSVFFPTFGGPEPQIQNFRNPVWVSTTNCGVPMGFAGISKAAARLAKKCSYWAPRPPEQGAVGPTGGSRDPTVFLNLNIQKSARPKLHTGGPHPQPPIRPHPSGG